MGVSARGVFRAGPFGDLGRFVATLCGALLCGALMVVRPPLDPNADDWDVARSAVDGPERTAAMVRALAPATLAELAPAARQERLQVGFQIFLGAEARRAGVEWLAIAEALFTADRALWSAFCLEGALRKGFGRYDDAERLLAELQAEHRGPEGRAERLELIGRRALVAAGAGQAAQERALLGQALGLGSQDARQILGFAALRAGDLVAARAHFGALFERGTTTTADRDLPAWALRGFGVALLPASVVPPR